MSALAAFVGTSIALLGWLLASKSFTAFQSMDMLCWNASLLHVGLLPVVYGVGVCVLLTWHD
jgi:hypothetical protein